MVHYLSYQCYLYFKISINNSDKGNKYFILFHFKGKLRKKYWPTFDFKLMWLWNRIHVNLKDWWREITIMSASINLSNRFLLQLLLQLIWKCLLNENFNPLSRTNLWFIDKFVYSMQFLFLGLTVLWKFYLFSSTMCKKSYLNYMH